MPSWEFLGQEKIANLTAYVQSLGGKDADYRVARQDHWQKPALRRLRVRARQERRVAPRQRARRSGGRCPTRTPPPRPTWTRGKQDLPGLLHRLPRADGRRAGPRRQVHAAAHGPPPLNFTTLRRHLVEGKYIGGIFYYQIMNGITGTAMPYFKRELESEKIWDVSNYVAVRSSGYTDATLEPRGIPAAYEPPWTNTYQPPAVTPPGRQAMSDPGRPVARHLDRA